ncbi:probable regulatory protein [[Actinomadura] parvosata subsp. kistnae]|uniref:Serine/threonine protein phosphatase n=1 Tax=[Actinomadura] parvosata subsp. kistnae TaxID=1909395 RepID=A0A1U9ZSZ7_9ACTN|nr:PP2C family protein-serine/threonine phosphatase [Nonomuraea sp. ATCC 55076]AQZ61076.1 serine/threonine protein phosphatase [Nonomuraea sp. ATCC 55076]SPL87556.1 probable regulatory protein [Actinomadura parvosata subsp. kistnae]
MTDDARSRRRDGPRLRTPVMAVAGILVTAVVVTLDIATGTAVRLFPLLIFLPAIVSALGEVWQTALATVWVILVEIVTGVAIGAQADDNLLAAGFMGVFGGLSMLGCRYRVRREEEVHRLRSAAAALQRLIVRPLPLRTADVVVNGLYQPVEEDAMVGGDMYEVAASRHGTRVLIADVQGKGLPAIGTALAVLGSFREAAYREHTLTGVVAALENSVVRQNAFAAQTGEPERLVTALVLDIGSEPVVEAVNCGHIAPFVIHDGEAAQVDLGEPAVPLGLAALSSAPRKGARFTFPRGATMLLCTDGVTEARDPGGAFYPLEARLRAYARAPTGGLAAALGADLRAFTGAVPRDDIAILTLRRADPAARSALRRADPAL